MYNPSPHGDLFLEDRIRERQARINAEKREMLPDIAEFDRKQAWRADGANSMEHWLQIALGLSPATAREYVATAKALDMLPAIADSFGAGLLSFDQLKPLASFATIEEDEELSKTAPGWSPAWIEVEARRRRRITRERADRIQNRRYLTKRWLPGKGALRLTALLPFDQGAVVEKSLELLADEMRKSRIEAYSVLYADALTELASADLTSRTDADRATIVVHVDAKELSDENGVGALENGVQLSAETIRRLSCDGRMQVVVHDDGGKPIGVGRTTRVVPPWIGRIVRERDNGCAFPDCDRQRWTQIHHIVPYEHGADRRRQPHLSLRQAPPGRP